MEQQTFENATVVKQTGSLYRLTFLPGWDPFTAVLSGRLRLKGSKLTNPITVGDKVSGHWEPGSQKQQKKAVITEIHPRKKIT
jgi:ribosome biogenesis GTPase